VSASPNKGAAAALLDTWRARPVFVSSTFRDMHAERDWLRQRVFPRLEEELRKRRHHLEPIDLRLGVGTGGAGSEEEREVRVLKVCLDEVRRSRPFLLVLLGDRYGWVPPEERLAAAARDAGLATDFRERSVTALEVEFGLLAGDPAQARRSLVLLREPLPYDEMPEVLRADYSDACAPDPRARERHARLAALKGRLRDDPEIGPRVFSYRARWDPATRRVTGLEEFGDLVFEKLWAALDEETREFAGRPPPSWEEGERLALAEFVEHRRRVFVGRDDLLARLLALARGEPASAASGVAAPVRGACVTGAPGSGKSALFAEVHGRLAADTSVLLLANAAGATARGASVDAMLRRWIHETARLLGAANPLGERSTAEEVEAAFHELLASAAARRRVVLLLDALDQAEPTPRGQHLTWLHGRPWPAGAWVVATAVPGKAAAALCEWGVERIELPPLTAADAREIGRRVWRLHHREASPVVLDVLAAKARGDGTPAAGNPLWLTLALEQLNLLDADDFSRAERDFEGPPAKRMEALVVDTAGRLPADVAGLYRWMFDRVSKAFGAERLRAFLAAVALGRHGWRESDLQVLVPRLAAALAGGTNASAANLVEDAAMRSARDLDELAHAPRPEDSTPLLELAAVRRAFRFDLVLRNELQWDFFHREAREAARRYLELDPDVEKAAHAVVAAYLIGLRRDDPVRCDEVTYHLLRAGELAWVQIFYGSTHSTHPREIAAATAAFVDEVETSGAQWLAAISNTDVVPRAIDENGVDRVPDFAKKDVRRDVARGWCRRCVEELLPALASSVGVAERRTVIRVLLSRLSDAARDFPGDDEVQRLLAVLRAIDAGLSVKEHDWATARRRADEAMLSFEKLADEAPSDAARNDDLASALLLQGDLEVQRGDLDGAERTFQRARDIARPLLSGRSPRFAVACDKLGDVARKRQRFDAAREAYAEALPVFRDLAGAHPEHLRDLSLCLAKLGELAQAEKEPERARPHLDEHLRIAEQIARADPEHAEHQRDLAGAHGRLMHLEREAGDRSAALRHAEATHRVLEALAPRDPGNASWVQDLAGSFYNLGGAVADSGDGARAAELFAASARILRGLHAGGRLDAQGRGLMLGVAVRVADSQDRELAADAVCAALDVLKEAGDETARAVVSVAALRLGSRLLDAGSIEAAERVTVRLLSVAVGLFGETSPQVVGAANLLGIAMKRKGDLAAAETAYRRAYRASRSLEGRETEMTRALHQNLMWVLLRTRAVAVGEPEHPAPTVEGIEWAAHDGQVLAVAIDAAGERLASGGADTFLKIWSPRERAPLHAIAAHRAPITGLAMTRDGSRVFSCSWDRAVKAWDAGRGELLAHAGAGDDDLSVSCERDGSPVLVVGAPDLCSVSCTPDGSLVLVGGEDGVVRRWSPRPGSELEPVGLHREAVMAVAGSHDGRRVLSGSADRTIAVREPEGAGAVSTARGHDAVVQCVAMAPDGRVALSGAGDGSMLQWDLEQMEILRAFPAHAERLTALALSDDGRLALSGSWDRTVKLWDLARGKLLARLELPSQVWALAATPDLRAVAVGEQSGTVSLLRLDPRLLSAAPG